MEPLQVEREYFDHSLEEWLKLYSGKVALVKGEQLIGVFDDEATALEEGARRFGKEPFLIRRIIPGEQTVSAPAYTLGILRANPSLTIIGQGPDA